MMKWFRRERDDGAAEPFDRWRVTAHLSNGQTWSVEGAALDQYDSMARRFYSTPEDQAETVRLVDGIANGLRAADFVVDVETERRFVSPR